MRKGIVFGLFFWAVSLQGTTYQIVELPSLGAASVPTAAYGMSDFVDIPPEREYQYVAGASGTGGSQRPLRWTVWQNGATATSDVGLLSPYTWGVAYDANDFGEVVGSMANRQAFLWQPGPPSLLQPILATAPARCLAAYAINDAGKVVGFYSKAVQGSSVLYPGWAFGWSQGAGVVLYDGFVRTSLGSTARAVNSIGVVAGSAEVSPTGGVIAATQAYTWPPKHLLGAFDGEDGSGFAISYGINNIGQVVGESEGQAFLWNGTTGMIDLGPGTARDINSFGDIVGTAPKAGGGTFAFFLGPMGFRQDLNTLATVPAGTGWQLAEAWAISDRGWIAGIGSRLVNGARITKGFVLIPQP